MRLLVLTGAFLYLPTDGLRLLAPRHQFRLGAFYPEGPLWGKGEAAIMAR
jgi:hypothetical protein